MGTVASMYIRDLDGPHFCSECAAEILHGEIVLSDVLMVNTSKGKRIAKIFHHADCKNPDKEVGK